MCMQVSVLNTTDPLMHKTLDQLAVSKLAPHQKYLGSQQRILRWPSGAAKHTGWVKPIELDGMTFTVQPGNTL